MIKYLLSYTEKKRLKCTFCYIYFITIKKLKNKKKKYWYMQPKNIGWNLDCFWSLWVLAKRVLGEGRGTRQHPVGDLCESVSQCQPLVTTQPKKAQRGPTLQCNSVQVPQGPQVPKGWELAAGGADGKMHSWQKCTEAWNPCFAWAVLRGSGHLGREAEGVGEKGQDLLGVCLKKKKKVKAKPIFYCLFAISSSP